MMTSNHIISFYNFIREMHSNMNNKIDQSEVITTAAKSHQIRVFNWMLHREKTGILATNGQSIFRRGIIADVGLGKTFEILCCIMAHPASPQFFPIFPTPKIQKYLPFLNKNILDRQPMNSSLRFSKEMLTHIQRNKPKMIKIEMGFNNLFVINCYCYLTPDNSSLVICALCGKAQYSVYVNFKPKPFLENLYMCPSCWNLNGNIDYKAALIIVPLKIMSQWINEIEKHISKPKKILIYIGVHSGSFIDPTAFNGYDISITSYSHLEDDINAIQNPLSKDVLIERKIFKTFIWCHESSLFSLNWWRICMDECQNYINKSTFRVIPNISYLHKWAMSGTPFMNSLKVKDFELITKVMELNKYFNTTVLPFNINEHKFLWISYIMWRTSVINIDSALIFQKPTIEYNWLTFSDIEKQCYKIQQNEIIDEITRTASSLNLSMNDTLKTFGEKKLFNLVSLQLLKLRQACVHPQNIQGELVKLTEAMSMDNLADFMIERAGDECNEILYPIISNHEEIAQIYIGTNKTIKAINQYKLVLDLIQKHEKKNLKANACQKMRTMYNLDTLLDTIKVSDDEDVYTSNGLKNLKTEMVNFEKENLDIHVHNVKIAQKKVEIYLNKIAMLKKNKTLCTSQWWPDMATFFSLTEDFLDTADAKWEEYRAFGIPNMGTRFRSVEDIYETLEFWSTHLNKTRDEVVVCIKLLINTPIDDLARAAMLCHAAEKSSFVLFEKRCLVCRARVSLGTYKELLFSFSNKQENIPLDTLIKNKKPDNDVWTMSLNEFLLTILLEYGQANTQNKKHLKNAANHIKILKLIREEFEHLLQLWSYICDNISTHIDINLQAKSISYDDMIKPKDSKTSTEMGKLKQISLLRKDSTSVFDETNLQFKIELLESKIISDQDLLTRNYGILHYLEYFKYQEGNTVKNEPCTICALVKNGLWAVLRCGHKLCQPCLFQLQNNALVNTTTTCPICRDYASAKTICYGKRYDENQDRSVKIKGSFSTKVESIIVKLMGLINQDPAVKILIFSNWEKSLHCVGEALKKNSINYRLLIPGKEYQKTLNEFKNNIRLNIILLKMGKASKGLDLTVATTIFFMEPAINKEEDNEVMSRVLKIGQTKSIFVYYFIMRDSIEETIENTLSRLSNWDNLTLTQLIHFYKTQT